MSLYEKRNSKFFHSVYRGRPLACGSHLHRHIEVVYMFEGHSGALVDSRPVDIHEDCLFIVFPSQVHSYEGLDPQAYHLMIIDPDLFPELSSKFDGTLPENPVLENASAHPELLTLLELIRKANQDRKNTDEQSSEAALRGLGLAFLSLFLDLLPLEKSEGRNGDSVRKVLDYCAMHYTEDISLEELSRSLHMSKYYVSHIFSDQLHTGFIDYINTLRLSEACRYLESTEKNVTEIGELVGFGTTRTFNRVFKSRYQVSPSEYRQSREARRTSFPSDTAPKETAPKETAEYNDPCCDCDF